ncbi:hypothetical protein SNE40_020049 [Patella caerulea]|uniref:Armadillo repeat-containing protein 2 n=1 Tax=Patella caerulea TaxID=87958 RepID=A0AAN8G6S1_PATCE
MEDEVMDRRSKEKDRPFYALPESLQAPSKIINEARTSLRTVVTKRPFTPRDDKRTLFPASTSRNPESRPASAFSLNSKHFDGSESRPVSGTRLMPLDHTPRFSPVELENCLPPRPPDGGRPISRKGSRSRIHFDGNSEQLPVIVNRGRSGSLSDGNNEIILPPSAPEVGRKTNGGPSYRDRTPPYIPEERGVGDGREMPTRISSSLAISSSTSSCSKKDDGENRLGSGGSRKSSAGNSSNRTGSSGKKDTDDESLVYFNNNVFPVLEEMASLGKKKDTEKLIQLAEELYTTLEKDDRLNKHNKQRSSILKAIFKLLDVDEPKVLLKLARLILGFKVSGNNLINVCKLVFKVSRNEKNDNEFLDGKITELLLETIKVVDHETACEALIYCVGTIKFLTGNSTLLKQLARKECIETLSRLLHNINKTNREYGKINEQFGHILVQLAAAMRNLADVGSSRERMFKSHFIEELIPLIETYPGDCDLMHYLSRILSKITMHTDCVSVLCEQPNCFKSFINLINRHINKEGLVVRLCFVLGNITAKRDDSRLRLYQETDGMETFLTVLKTYQTKYKQIQNGNEVLNGTGEDNIKTKSNDYEDVLVKVIRVIANLSINETLGPLIASNDEFVQILLTILEEHDVYGSEELVLNTIASINNLSYYTIKSNAVTAKEMEISLALLKTVSSKNMEGMVETARVFGNLTRHREVRDFLSINKVDAMMMTLLDSGSLEVVYIACGVLMNFMTDEDKRFLLKKEGAISKLIEVLRDFGREDWHLSSIVCKVLCNYSTKITSSSDCFGERESQELVYILVEYLDKESALNTALNDTVEEEVREYIYETWQLDFKPVAAQLLKRIEMHQSQFEPLENPA